MPLSTSIDHNFHDLQPVLPVNDVGTTVAYYRDRLGFKIDFTVGDPPFYARVSRDKVMIQFSKVSPESGAFTYIHLGHVDGRGNLDELFEEYRAKGVTVTLEPTVQVWGLREFEVEDCDGRRIRFAVDARNLGEVFVSQTG